MAITHALRPERHTSSFCDGCSRHYGGLHVWGTGAVAGRRGRTRSYLIGSPNAVLNGIVLALFPIVLAPVGLVAKRFPPRIALGIGSVISVLGMGVLVLAVGRHDLLIFLAGTASAGAAYSLLFVGGFGLIDSTGSLHHRWAVFSALYLVGYLSMAVPSCWASSPRPGGSGSRLI